MTKPVLTIATCWAAAAAQLPPDIDRDARETLRSAFYSGAAAALIMFRSGVELETLAGEVQDTARAEMARQEREL